MQMTISPEGLDFVKSWEKFVPYLYDDFRPAREWDGGPIRGTLTIGYGHTRAGAGKLRMTKGLRIVEAEAGALLRADLAPVEAAICAVVSATLTQHQFDALVSFRFNTGRLAGTTLLSAINGGRLDRVPGELRKWVKSKGKVLKGLQNRRAGEIALWNRN